MSMQLFQAADIDKALSESGVQSADSDWINKVVSGIGDSLKKDPIRYRSYGPYWWAIKRYLIDLGYEVGEELEGAVPMDYPAPYYAIAAGIMLSAGRLQAHFGDNRYLYLMADGSQTEYVLEDGEMESIITAYDMIRSDRQQ